MKILFMGTPDFAAVSLEKLINAGFDICGVFTREDKPKGRGMKLTYPPVKEVANANNIPVYQPKTLKDNAVLDILKGLNPDIIIVVAYGRILPKYVLDFPDLGCINVHGSLLPKYRGAAPIQWSVINGDETTGITTMYMNEGLDTGDMLLKAETKIDINETSGDLFERLKYIGADLLVDTLGLIEKGEIKPIVQDETQATFAPMLEKIKIDFSKPALEIHNIIRGYNPMPLAYIDIDDINIKIYKSIVVDEYINGEYGTIVSTDAKDGLKILCGDNKIIKILELAAPGKKRMKSEDFLRGYKFKNNKCL